MTDYITLLGAESVERAGRNIVGAAEQMQRAADQIGDSLRFHRECIDEWATRMERLVDRLETMREERAP